MICTDAKPSKLHKYLYVADGNDIGNRDNLRHDFNLAPAEGPIKCQRWCQGKGKCDWRCNQFDMR